MRIKKKTRIFLYFTFWLVLAAICTVLNILNVDWDQTNMVGGIFGVATLAILQGSVLEFPLQTIVTLLIGGKTRQDKRAPCHHLSVILNYNLLATSKEEIDDCMKNMYKAYVGNLSPQYAAVLVSATNNEELKQYEIQARDGLRKQLYEDLYFEGIAFSNGDYSAIDSIHFKNIWEKFLEVDKQTFLSEILENVCAALTNNFMVLHRVSKVLRKCGQYQDLMLLSEGIKDAFFYCDSNYYGKLARNMGEPLFYDGDDLNNICGRKFDYTLVLDSDTRVTRGIVFDLMQIAAAHPKRAIIQPAVKLHCKEYDSLFMHLECIRQSVFEPMTNASMALLQQCSFYGKGLIQNKLYIDTILGTKDRPIERVPVDVLSHDTFEAAILKPLYAGSVFLLEEPCHNFVTWSIRERRWNRGEVITAMYIWNHVFGIPMRALQRLFQRSRYNNVRLRTETKPDFVTSHIAHSAFRHMLMKPLLVIYILCHILFEVIFKNVYISITIVMFLILIFPKIAICTRHNFKFVIIETLSSILQFTPEAIVGTVRLFRAFYANISLNTKWTPQRTVENKFKTQNCFWLSIKELWGYSLFALISTILIILFLQHSTITLIMTSIIFILPLFSGFTALPLSTFRRKKKVKSNPNSNIYHRNLNVKKHKRQSMFEGSYSSILQTQRQNALNAIRSQVKSELASKTEYSLYNGTQLRFLSYTRFHSTFTNYKDLENLIDNTFVFRKKFLIAGSFTRHNVHTNGNILKENLSSAGIMIPRPKQRDIDVYEIYNISTNATQSLNSQMSRKTALTNIMNLQKSRATALTSIMNLQKSRASAFTNIMSNCNPSDKLNSEQRNNEGKHEKISVIRDESLSQRDPGHNKIFYINSVAGSLRAFDEESMLY